MISQVPDLFHAEIGNKKFIDLAYYHEADSRRYIYSEAPIREFKFSLPKDGE